jgi:hypothetical protein
MMSQTATLCQFLALCDDACRDDVLDQSNGHTDSCPPGGSRNGLWSMAGRAAVAKVKHLGVATQGAVHPARRRRKDIRPPTENDDRGDDDHDDHDDHEKNREWTEILGISNDQGDNDIQHMTTTAIRIEDEKTTYSSTRQAGRKGVGAVGGGIVQEP